MNAAARWSRVSSILSGAVDLPDAKRGAFLADAIAREPTLRTEIVALFEEMRRTEGFLEQPAVPPEAGPADSEGFFGPYRVVGKLGEGGMGVVYLADAATASAGGGWRSTGSAAPRLAPRSCVASATSSRSWPGWTTRTSRA